MNINNNTSVNFQAQRVILAENVKNSMTHNIEILKLDKNDIDFAQDCLETISSHKERVTPKIKTLIAFLKDFITEYKRDFGNKKDYFIGLKNGETIRGGFKIENFNDQEILVKDFFNMHDGDYLTKDSFMKTIFSRALGKKRQKNKNVTFLDKNECICNEIPSKKIKIESNKIDRKYHNYNFQEQSNYVNIMDYIG